jgi:hypothetical protein
MEKAHDSDEGEAVGLQQIHAACVLHEACVRSACRLPRRAIALFAFGILPCRREYIVPIPITNLIEQASSQAQDHPIFIPRSPTRHGQGSGLLDPERAAGRRRELESRMSWRRSANDHTHSFISGATISILDFLTTHAKKFLTGTVSGLDQEHTASVSYFCREGVTCPRCQAWFRTNREINYG